MLKKKATPKLAKGKKFIGGSLNKDLKVVKDDVYVVNLSIRRSNPFDLQIEELDKKINNCRQQILETMAEKAGVKLKFSN